MRQRSAFLLIAILTAAAPLGGGQRLEAGKPTPADEFRALSDEFKKASKEYDASFFKAGTDEERRTIRARFRRWRVAFIGRMLKFAEEHPGDDEALAAIFFALHADSEAERGQVEKALGLVLKDHAASERLTRWRVLQLAGDSPAAEKVMRGVLEKTPHRPVQAEACLRLGQIIKRKAKAAAPERGAKLTREAEGYFERV